MADQPSTAAKKSKKFGNKLLQPLRNLVKTSKSINASPISNPGSLSSVSGAHDSVPGNDTGSVEPISSGANATSHQHQYPSAPLQSARPPLLSILPAVAQEEIHKTGLASASTAKDNLKAAGRFLQSLLKKAPDYADSNPVKIALSIIKTIIEIKDDVGSNKERFTQGLRDTEATLQSLEGIVVPEAVQRNFDNFEQKIRKEKENLEELAGKLVFIQILDYEEYKKRIQQIFHDISTATMSFQLALEINSQIKEGQIHDDIKKATLQRLNPSAKADHRTFFEHQTLKREECTAGTRVRILEQITDWANDCSSDSARVFWLTGQAGSGKTTIAYTIAKQFEKDGNSNQHTILGATFFCSRQFSETQGQTRILPTVAYHLAHRCRSYADALHIADKFDAVNHHVSTQMLDLLVRPWEQSESTRSLELSPYLIIIDALDEIEGTGGSDFLRSLLLTINEYDLQGLKFLVTSRSDPALVELCETFVSEAVCRLQDVPIAEAKSDIKQYLKDKLPMIAGKPELDKLVLQAGGLFIYAATVVRYLTLSRSLTNDEQIEMLNDLLSRETAPEGNATSLVDGLYQQIMWDTFSNLDKKIMARRLRILHTFLCTIERTSTSIVAELIPDSNNEAAKAVLRDLHAVLYLQDNRVFWYHASFPDFIFDRARSNFHIGEKSFMFSCDKQAQHNLLAQSCFRVMKSCLRFNMANIPSSFLFDRENVDALSEQVNRNITPVLRYSCSHWAHHLPLLQVVDTDILCSFISDFLQIRVLFWIETMNLLGLCNQCTPMLQSTRQWVLKWRNLFLELARDVGEAANFATYFSGSPAAELTPHLYISALATWSQNSSLSQNWKKSFSRIPVFTHTTGNVDLPLMTIPARSKISAVAFSSNGTQIVSGSHDSSVRVWDASTGAEVKVLNGHRDTVLSVAFSSDSMWIVSGSYDKSVRVWDVSTGVAQKVLNGHTDWVTSVAFSSHGTQIVSGSDDKSVRVWDALTGAEQKVLNGHTDMVSSVAFSSDSMYIVSGSYDNSVRVWDALTGAEVKVLNGHRDTVLSVAFSSDGMWIVSGSYDKSVRVWDVPTSAEKKVLNGHTDWVTSVALSGDGTQIVSGSDDKSVRVWDLSTGAEQKVLNGHTSYVTSVAFSMDGMRLMSGSYDKSVRVWNASTGANLKAENGYGQRIVPVSGPHDESVQVWDALACAEQKILNGHTDMVSSVAFSSDGTQIVSGSYDNSVRVWDALTGAELKVLNGHTGLVCSVAFSSDGTRIVSGSHDESVRVWDVLTGAELNVLIMNGHTNLVLSVAFSRDGTQIVSGSQDQSVRVWDASTGAEQKILNGHTDMVFSVAFSSDGTQIVSGSYDNSVRVWDVSTGAEQKALYGHTGSVVSVAFSNDGMRIVSGSDDKSVRVWDMLTGAELMVLNGHTRSVDSVAFSNDGAQIVSGSDDESVRVWDVSTGVEQKVLYGHTGSVVSAAFSSDSKRIVSGSHDQSLRVWDVSKTTSTNYERYVWTLTETNWIIPFQGKDHLMWVPRAAGLPQPSNILVISRFGFAAVDFTQAKIGTDWVYCYTP